MALRAGYAFELLFPESSSQAALARPRNATIRHYQGSAGSTEILGRLCRKFEIPLKLGRN
jgi:hypothetical protein